VLSGTAFAEDVRVPDDMAPNSAARQACAQAMNDNPDFALSIASTVDKQIEQKTLDAHLDAARHIQKNEKHVIYAYAAMWIVAALFVIFLWRRQHGLEAQIAQLKKDLEAAAK